MSFLSFFQRPSFQNLQAILIAEHPGAGTDAADRFHLQTHHGVRIWTDRQHRFASGFGTVTATRAVTLGGTLLWCVEDTDRANTYLAEETDGYAAMDAALRAWDCARQLRDAPDALHQLIGDLRCGTVAFRVDLEDAKATPMSTFGFRAVLEASGLLGVNRVSAQSVLRLMRRQPLLAHVLFAAWSRVKASPQSDAPIGFEAMC